MIYFKYKYKATLLRSAVKTEYLKWSEGKMGLFDNFNANHTVFDEEADEHFWIAAFGYHNFSVLQGASKDLLNVMPWYTLHYIVDGEGYYNIGGKIYHLGKDDIFFTPKGSKLCYYPDDEKAWI